MRSIMGKGGCFRTVSEKDYKLVICIYGILKTYLSDTFPYI